MKSIDEYFLKKVTGKTIISGENVFKLKHLLKHESFKDQFSSKESALIETMYLAIVEPIVKIIGVIGEGEPFYTWLELQYEKGIIQAAIRNLEKLSRRK